MNDAIREKLKSLPEKPGCYIMRDRKGRIIYVGKAVDLKRRVSSYFRKYTMRRGDPKVRSLVNSAQDIEWIVLKSEDEALLTEDELIKRHKPRYNILLKDDKRYLGIRADARDPLPRLKACRLVRDDGAEYFGPFPTGGSHVRPVIDFLERKYGLRRCQPIHPDDETYRHCMDDVVRTCSAPCIGRISHEGYRANFAEACACLRGERPLVIEEARLKMEEAARSRNFEQAASIRDAWLGLKEMAHKRAVGPKADMDMHRKDAEHGLRQLQEELRLPTMPRVIECFDISNTGSVLAVASMVVAVDGIPDRRRYRHFRMRDYDQQNDPAMIAQAVTRRYSRLRDEGSPFPDLVILDGGITQLRAARAALAALGVEGLPTVGLAESFEELVTDDGRPPLFLPRDSDGLMVVTRLRDEAHRFAITYNRRLHNRTVRESALDEIPGIGPAKKMMLLRAYGSVYRLARAPRDELAAQPGIGPVLADAIIRALAPTPYAAEEDEGVGSLEAAEGTD